MFPWGPPGWHLPPMGFPFPTGAPPPLPGPGYGSGYGLGYGAGYSTGYGPGYGTGYGPDMPQPVPGPPHGIEYRQPVSGGQYGFGVPPPTAGPSNGMFPPFQLFGPPFGPPFPPQTQALAPPPQEDHSKPKGFQAHGPRLPLIDFTRSEPPGDGELEGYSKTSAHALLGWFHLGHAPDANRMYMNQAALAKQSRGSLSLSNVDFSFQIGNTSIPSSELPSHRRCAHIRATGNCPSGDCYLQHSAVDIEPWICPNEFCGGHAFVAGPPCYTRARIQLRSVVEEARGIASQPEYIRDNIPCFRPLLWVKEQAAAQGRAVPLIADFEAAVVFFEKVGWMSRGRGARADGVPDEYGDVSYSRPEAVQKGFQFKGLKEFIEGPSDIDLEYEDYE